MSKKQCNSVTKITAELQPYLPVKTESYLYCFCQITCTYRVCLHFSMCHMCSTSLVILQADNAE